MPEPIVMRAASLGGSTCFLLQDVREIRRLRDPGSGIRRHHAHEKAFSDAFQRARRGRRLITSSAVHTKTFLCNAYA